MDVQIFVEANKIFLEYYSYNGIEWIISKFNNKQKIKIKHTFWLSEEDLASLYDEPLIFQIGYLDNDYYRIYSKILNTNNDVLFHERIKLKLKYFIVNSNFSILSRFEKLANQQIIIGGEKENSISLQVFTEIVDSFPSKIELKYYLDSRITNVLSQYLEGVKDAGKLFENYIEKRNKIGNLNTIPSIKSYEYEKYHFLLTTLKNMLVNINNYSERDWQNKILDIILILYPKYIKCYSEVSIKDYYTNPLKTITRYIDLMLIDSNGNVDVIEIKKPFDNCIISKNTYRDNYTPMKELSGTIMQVEKYIFHLNKWGIEGEKNLSKKYKDNLPLDFRIRITNPKGIVILGRNNNLREEQLFDLEIIKRKYSNLIDIITYDDLILRLENLLEKYK